MNIVVTNVKGGVGKTTTAVYLAALLGSSRPVVLVDADPQATAAEWLEERRLEGVQLVEAPSERLVMRTAELGQGAVVLIDTPPGSERIVRAALSVADVVIIPTRAGGVEVSRVQATLAMVPEGVACGVVVTSARIATKDVKETVAGWAEAGVRVFGVIPERVGIAAGPDAELSADGLAAYQIVLDAVLAASAVGR